MIMNQWCKQLQKYYPKWLSKTKALLKLQYVQIF